MTMNRQQREEVLRDALGELEEARAELVETQRKVTYLQQVVDGLTGLLDRPETLDTKVRDIPPLTEHQTRAVQNIIEKSYPVKTVSREDSRAENPGLDLDGNQGSPAYRAPVARVKPRQAVLEVMAKTPNVPLAPRQVVDLVRASGLFDDSLKSGANGYTTALNRLADDPGSPIMRDPNGSYIFRGRYSVGDAIGAQLTGHGQLSAGGPQ